MTSRFSAFFMIAFLVLGGLLSLYPAYESLAAVDKNGRNFLAGRAALAYEKDFNKRALPYDFSIQSWALLNYLLFGDARAGALIGSDKWLFTSEEFVAAKDQDREFTQKTAYIRDVAAKLKSRNISLLVAIVPAKARIYDDRLGRFHFPSYKQGIYGRAESALSEAGVPVCDLRPPFEREKDRRPLYFRTDTHWTPDGARIAAAQIAHCLQAAWPGLLQPGGTYATTPDNTETFAGDLTRYLPLGPLADRFGFSDETTHRYKTEAVSRPGDEANLLFGDDTPPVTLVGTSYSANPRWHFAGFLRESLGNDVLNAAEEGLGPFETMDKYLKNAAFTKTPPKAIVWEIPERYLTMHYGAGKDAT